MYTGLTADVKIHRTLEHMENRLSQLSKAMQEAKKCTTYFCFIENGLFVEVAVVI